MNKNSHTYSPNGWHWDPNNHLPVYVLETYFVDDAESPTDQIEYALVYFPKISPNNTDHFMGNMNLVWMVATDLVPIRKQCEFQL